MLIECERLKVGTCDRGATPLHALRRLAWLCSSRNCAALLAWSRPSQDGWWNASSSGLRGGQVGGAVVVGMRVRAWDVERAVHAANHGGPVSPFLPHACYGYGLPTSRFGS